jgi:hypothetical protein
MSRHCDRAFARTLIVAGLTLLALSAITGSALANTPIPLQNASLEQASGATPASWLLGGYGTNSYSWSHTTDAHSGTYAERLSVSKYQSGDRKLLSAFSDSSSPSVTTAHVYSISVWYKSSARPIIFAFGRSASTGSYSYWTQSPKLATSSSWRQASWTTPPVPAGITNLSIGLGLQSGGSLTMDDFAFADATPVSTPDTTPPTVSVTAPTAGATVGGTVTLSAAASDNGGVARVDFFVDGSSVGTDATAPYSVAWSSASVADGAHTIAARAVDAAGNQATSAGATVSVANNAVSPPPIGYFSVLPSGASGLPRGDSYCAANVTASTWEPRADNYAANHQVPGAAVQWSNAELGTYWAKWIADRGLVTGNYTGTTNQIIQWAACKWGLDEDLLRAVAVQESDWHESMVGDNCGVAGEASYGLFQIKNAYCSGGSAWGGYPYTATYTGLNADFYGAFIRSCLDDDFYDGGNWLYGGQTIAQIVAANGLDYAVWGCVGAWFSGGWYDAGAKTYIASVQQHLANQDWLEH